MTGVQTCALPISEGTLRTNKTGQESDNDLFFIEEARLTATSESGLAVNRFDSQGRLLGDTDTLGGVFDSYLFFHDAVGVRKRGDRKVISGSITFATEIRGVIGDRSLLTPQAESTLAFASPDLTYQTIGGLNNSERLVIDETNPNRLTFRLETDVARDSFRVLTTPFIPLSASASDAAAIPGPVPALFALGALALAVRGRRR